MSMTELKAPCRRRYERMTVMWSGTLTMGRREIGCIVSSVATVLECSRIGKFRAKVVWIRGDQVGLRFLEKPQHVARALALTIP